MNIKELVAILLSLADKYGDVEVSIMGTVLEREDIVVESNDEGLAYVNLED